MTQKILHAACAAILIAAIGFMISSAPRPRSTAVPIVRKDANSASTVRRNRVEQQLAECDRKVAELIGRQLQTVHTHFAAARQRVPRFSAAALGLRSKWVLVADWLPGSEVSHQDYLRKLFEDEVTSGEALEELVQHVLRTTADEIEGLEGELLVDLALDLPDSSAGRSGSVPKTERLRQLPVPLREQVVTDLRWDIGREIAAYAAGEALTVGMGRLGVSAGLLGAGAGSSWTTFGIGILAGVIIDEIVSRIWVWWADPAGKLTALVQADLQKAEAELVGGRDGLPGLRQALVDLAQRRSLIRRQAILKALSDREAH